MKKIALALFVLISCAAFAGNNMYHAVIDLRTVVNDKVKVTIQITGVDKDEVVYCLPKIVPGTYSIYDFGRFVSDLSAYDNSGNKLPMRAIDVNQYAISNAKHLIRIEYWVDDSFDMTMENPVFEPAGTNIADGNFMVNTFGFIGYLEGWKDMGYSLEIQKPHDFYGSTALRAVQSNEQMDMYQLDNYDQLADSPMMYALADTASKMVGGAEVLIGVYSPNHQISAKQIMDDVSETLEAQEKYLGGKLPVDKYAFIFYFTDTAGVSGGMGALEHNRSSVYYLPEMPFEQIAPMLRDVCAHEFFHIVTPLNIHSEEIGNFNFIDPHMSRHLWLYEGQTEYAAHHAQVQAGLIDISEFLSRMQQKIMISQTYFNDTLPFTVMSANCLDQYKEQYGNVYQKGALINMCLDIELRKLSGGKYGTQQLMKDLGKEYGKNRSFDDASLFDIIAAKTYPEVRSFFAQYVDGSQPIPYETFLGYAGIKLSPAGKEKKLTLGNIAMNYDLAGEEHIITITDLSDANSFAVEMGYKTGDRIISVNGISFTSGDPDAAFDQWRAQTKAGDAVTMVVERENKKGKIKQLTLKGTAMEIEVDAPRNWYVDPNASADQVALRKAWLGS